MKSPKGKYKPFPKVDLPDRQWVNRTITKPPIWMSTDLRDGNQSLFEPMNLDKKLRLFKAITKLGIKEVEVGFPSASSIEFDFVRHLIEQNEIPDDVVIEVLTQARPHLIERTAESIRGAKKVIFHIYNATSKVFRDVVFGMSKEEVLNMAVAAVKQVKNIAETMPETEIVLEYSLETFTATELDFALEVSNAVISAWGATPDNKIILNLPTTVEVATPNIYADQIEWMCKNLARRQSVIVSLHPHNDRGTAVAAAEMGLMAGADRVEGCLFGNGERTGNVDLVTLALNMYTQGVETGLDFSDINELARTVEYCTQIPLHPRHPYAGDLVFTAFSGSHQDAIKKGFAVQKPNELWQVPYLPIDPADVGREYDSIIRVNSQSGKGGIAFLLEKDYGLVMPRRMQVEFSGFVQQHLDDFGSEVNSAILWNLFESIYMSKEAQILFHDVHFYESEHDSCVSLNLTINDTPAKLKGVGNGPIAAGVDALKAAGIHLNIRHYEERSLNTAGEGASAQACAFIEATLGNGKECFGVGVDENIMKASIKALISVAGRLLRS